jgi:NTE family protein
MRSVLALLLALLLAGCSTARPAWVNAAQTQLPPASPYRLSAPPAAEPAPQEALTLVLAFSGGGTRAAAFAHGVALELAATRVHWQGRDGSLLDELDLVSGVSGGSVTAAHLALYGQAGLDRFAEDFLYRDNEGELLRRSLHPTVAWRQSSPWLGFTALLQERLDGLFAGQRYGDLMRRPGAPLLLIGATELASGEEFVFTQDRFDALCSDLAEVPLSFAVASSSAVPLVLTPTLLRDHGGACLQSQRPSAPFLHLVDGGLADNLGLRHLLSLADAPEASPSGVQELVLITVDAAADPTHGIGASDRVPGLFQVIEALADTATERRSRETRLLLERTLARLPAGQRPQVSLVPLSLPHDEEAAALEALPAAARLGLRRIPTAFSLPRADVDRLILAGRLALRRHPAVQALVRRLAPPVPQPQGVIP